LKGYLSSYGTLSQSRYMPQRRHHGKQVCIRATYIYNHFELDLRLNAESLKTEICRGCLDILLLPTGSFGLISRIDAEFCELSGESLTISSDGVEAASFIVLSDQFFSCLNAVSSLLQFFLKDKHTPLFCHIMRKTSRGLSIINVLPSRVHVSVCIINRHRLHLRMFGGRLGDVFGRILKVVGFALCSGTDNAAMNFRSRRQVVRDNQPDVEVVGDTLEETELVGGEGATVKAVPFVRLIFYEEQLCWRGSRRHI
jgi:hypothetical protein